jgi:hypothetical protein
LVKKLAWIETIISSGGTAELVYSSEMELEEATSWIDDNCVNEGWFSGWDVKAPNLSVYVDVSLQYDFLEIENFWEVMSSVVSEINESLLATL